MLTKIVHGIVGLINVTWLIVSVLLVVNDVYIGMFAFVPFFVSAIIYAIVYFTSRDNIKALKSANVGCFIPIIIIFALYMMITPQRTAGIRVDPFFEQCKELCKDKIGELYNSCIEACYNENNP